MASSFPSLAKLQEHQKHLNSFLSNTSSTIEEQIDTLLTFFFSSRDENPPHDHETRETTTTSRIQVQEIIKSIHPLKVDVPSLLLETVLSTSIMKKNGIVHTPPWIARLMVTLSLTGTERVIMDPACGAGVFLHEIVNLGSTMSKMNLIGIEKNPIATLITRKRMQFLRKRFQIKEIEVVNADFFDFLMTRKKEIAGRTDLILGNPPYVRQEFLNDKQKLVQVIESIDEKPVTLDRKADLYIYFLHASLSILSERGKACFIIPDKWLTAKYGKSLRDVLSSQEGRITLIFLKRDIFPRIDVRPLIFLFEKKPNDECRRDTQKEQLRVIKGLDPTMIDKIVTLMTHDDHWQRKINNLLNQDQVAINKTTLQEYHNWSMVIHAPPFFMRMLKNNKTLTLHNNVISSVRYGNKTGANDFFFLTKKDLETWNISRTFLKPAIKSIKGIQGTTLNHPDSWLLQVPQRMSKEELLNKDSLKAYLEWGMKEPRAYQRRPSCYKSRTPRHLHDKCRKCPVKKVEDLCDGCHWYSLPLKQPPEFLLAKVNHINTLPVYNAAKAHPSDSIQCVYVLDSRHSDFLHAYLTSRMMRLAMEVFGRWEGGGALTLMIDDTRKLPILNPLKIATEEHANIVTAGKEILNARKQELKRTEMEALQDQLDLHVLSAWGEPPETLTKLKRSINVLQQKRLGKQKTTSTPI